MSQPRTHSQMVYVASIPSGYFKIGRTTNLVLRMKSIQVGCPERIRLEGNTLLADDGVDAASFEMMLHHLLDRYRSIGEWFKAPESTVVDAWCVAYRCLARDARRPRVARVGRKPGLPLVEDCEKTFAATKPWLSLGLSERTWYRRRAEGVIHEQCSS